MPGRNRVKGHCSKSRAFTLVELLVVIAIIGVLVALLLPAVQAARESARRTECTNKLRQVGGVALQSFHSTFGRFPEGARGRSLNDPNLGYVPEPGKPLVRIAFAVRILPYIEQGALRSNYDLTTTYHRMTSDPESPFTVPQPAFTCPSDESVQTTNCDGGTALDFKGNYGVNWGPWSYDCQVVKKVVTRAGITSQRGCSAISNIAAKEHGAPFGIEFGARIGQITDGTSNTLAMMEMVQTPEEGGACDRRGRIWNDDFGCYAINTRDTPNSSGVDVSICTDSDDYPCDQSVDVKQGRLVSRSRHPGGVVAVMCDSSVHFVNGDIDLEVWQAASSIAGGEVGASLK